MQEKISTENLAIITEQYNIFIEMADRISERRGKANQFYIAALTGLIAIMSFIISCSISEEYQLQIIIICSIFGVLLCIVWWINLQSYGKLNAAKFSVIHDIEEKLPFACYKDEWEYLGNGNDGKKYRQLTKVERFIPIIFSLPFIVAILAVLIK
ncbi:MAG: hypothetical protein RBT65_03040 [Methanolobus sp.]|nr:hypothetical protein [Methanolobus sp.]